MADSAMGEYHQVDTNNHCLEYNSNMIHHLAICESGESTNPFEKQTSVVAHTGKNVDDVAMCSILERLQT